MAAAAVTLLRLPLARISTHLRSIHSPALPPPPRRRFATSHRLLSSSLGHGPAAAVATAAASEVVSAPYDEEELVGATEGIHDELAQGEAPRPFVLPRLPRPKLTVKERKELASYAHGLGKKLKSQQVGKSGVTPSLVSAFTDNLESNELLKLKIHGNCPEELPDVILKLEESTGSVVVDQIGRSVILYRPSSSKMKKRQEVAKTPRRFVKSEETSEERPRATTGKRSFKPGWTFRAQHKRRPMASRGSSYSRG